jgi:hypothetical protein
MVKLTTLADDWNDCNRCRTDTLNAKPTQRLSNRYNEWRQYTHDVPTAKYIAGFRYIKYGIAPEILDYENETC